MSVIKPFAPKHKVEGLSNRLIITMPSLKFMPLLFLFCVWSILWLIFEVLFISNIFSEGLSLSGGIFVIAWSILGIFLILNLLWQTIGKEEIQITSTSITVSHVLLGYKRSREYLSENIEGLGLAHVNMKDVILPRGPFLWGTDITGLVSFDYGARTIRFASSIEEAEAKQIIAEINQKYPQYKK
jgi:hypothetical protein